MSSTSNHPVETPTFPTSFLEKCSREHTWTFDGGLTVPASPSPSVVSAPYSNPANVNPEEALVAPSVSCHMLVYLMLAPRTAFKWTAREDEASGVMTKNEQGNLWMSAVTLKPEVMCIAAKPNPHSGRGTPAPFGPRTVLYRELVKSPGDCAGGNVPGAAENRTFFCLFWALGNQRRPKTTRTRPEPTAF